MNFEFEESVDRSFLPQVTVCCMVTRAVAILSFERFLLSFLNDGRVDGRSMCVEVYYFRFIIC